MLTTLHSACPAHRPLKQGRAPAPAESVVVQGGRWEPAEHRENNGERKYWLKEEAVHGHAIIPAASIQPRERIAPLSRKWVA